MAGKCKDRKESLTNGDLCSEADSDSTSRRLSFLKMVGKGKMKRESMQDPSSQGPEEEPVEEVPEVKPREPLSGKQSTSESSHSATKPYQTNKQTNTFTLFTLFAKHFGNKH